MRILGIDPGSRHLGWGIIEAVGTKLEHVASGTLDAPCPELVDRLVYLGASLEALVTLHKPQVASVESIFHARNSHSALTLGHARGAVLYCLGRLGLPVTAYTPGQIKQANTGRGAAEKYQVQSMVRFLLGIKDAMQLDTSDALAAAICHAQHGDRLDRRVGAKAPQRSRRRVKRPS